VNIQFAEDGTRRVTHRDMLTHKSDGRLPVPFANIDTMESIACGFRMELGQILTESGEVVAEIHTGTELGNDFIHLKMGERQAIVRGLDLLRMWVKTFDPEATENWPEGLA
jgi:hypothetical protein